MVKTVEVTGAATRTVHDGKHMIVLHKGRKTTVAEESVPYLRQRKLIGKAAAEPAQGKEPDTAELDALIELAKEAGYTYEDSGNGWHTITGGDIAADEPVKVRGDDELTAKLNELVNEEDAGGPPA